MAALFDDSAGTLKQEQSVTLKATNISNLPTEILLKILKNIKTTTDLLTNVSFVSKQMNFLSKDLSVGLSFAIRQNTRPETALQIFKKWSNRITKLAVSTETGKETCQAIKEPINLT
jgi:hypothetical protein